MLKPYEPLFQLLPCSCDEDGLLVNERPEDDDCVGDIPALPVDPFDTNELTDGGCGGY